MAAEEKRILKMFHLLATNEGGFVKAGELAQRMELSERTVKGSMEQLRRYAWDHGCVLESIRGRGYTLRVLDEAAFNEARESLEIFFSNAERGDKNQLLHQLIRAISCREATGGNGYFRVEDLTDRLFVSRSAVKKEMPRVRRFLESYGLQLTSKPGSGLLLSGWELGQRLCLLELYENHFHSRVVLFSNDAFEQSFADRDDKDLIRKTVLDALRASNVRLFDLYANRLVDYFLLLRNRTERAEPIDQRLAPWSDWAPDLRAFPEHAVAESLTRQLGKIPGFSFTEGETLAVTALLLAWGDFDGTPDLPARFRQLNSQAEDISRDALAQLGRQFGMPFTDIDPTFQNELVPELIRLLIQRRLGLARCQMIGNSVSENAIKDSPMSMALAESLAYVLERDHELETNELGLQLLAVRFHGLCSRIPYPYRRRRVLVCARNGKASAAILADGIRRRFGDWWLEALDTDALYDARKFPPDAYDCVVGSFRSYAYRYVWPYIEVNTVMGPDDFERVRRKVLAKGYDLEAAMAGCGWEVALLHREFSAVSVPGFLQLLAYQWGTSPERKEELAAILAAGRFVRVHRRLLAVVVPQCWTSKRIFELYLLNRPMGFQGTSVRAVLFCCVGFDGEPSALPCLEQSLLCLQDQLEELAPWLTSQNMVETLLGEVRKRL